MIDVLISLVVFLGLFGLALGGFLTLCAAWVGFAVWRHGRQIDREWAERAARDREAVARWAATEDARWSRGVSPQIDQLIRDCGGRVPEEAS